MRKFCLALVAFAALGALAVSARAAGSDDAYASGYAAGWLDQEFGVRGATVSAQGGEVSISARELRPADEQSAARALLRVPQIHAVRFEDGSSFSREGEPAPASRWHAFPRRPLFDPLLADPRWPSLGGSMRRYFRRDSNAVWAANFGGAFSFFTHEGDTVDWQLGMQACGFTLWDLETVSDDNINDDFLVGFPVSWRAGPWSAMARLYHISSHLGDEFMEHHPWVERMNLSFEAVDGKVSYDFRGGARLYGGAGYIVRPDPRDIGRGMLQLGAEYAHPRLWAGVLRPIAALDLEKKQIDGWGPTGLSARAGVQVEHRSQPSRRFVIELEYYKGRSPDGQFFTRYEESLGLGAHLYY